MAPGPKKKAYSRKSADTPLENKKNLKSNLPEKSSDMSKTVSKDQIIEETRSDEGLEKRFSKRTISSNWKKYEETDLHSQADVKRGEDFEVLISFSGGAGTQLQLQDEKAWELTGDAEASFALNMKDLVHVVNCIPFHKLINLPGEVLSKELISEFTSSAEKWKQSYQPSTVTPVDSVETKPLKSKDVVESLDSDLNVISSYEADLIEETKPSTSILLDVKTESIIDSLASCLSMKTSSPEKKAPSIESKKETPHLADDLDFLLSLNVTLKNPVKEENKDESGKTDVDDWLSSIIDE